MLLVGLLYYLGVFRLARWLNRRRLVILTYHGVLPDARGEDRYLSRNFVDEKMFRWQMTYLAKRYHCLKLSEAIELLKLKEMSLKEAAAATGMSVSSSAGVSGDDFNKSCARSTNTSITPSTSTSNPIT